MPPTRTTPKLDTRASNRLQLEAAAVVAQYIHDVSERGARPGDGPAAAAARHEHGSGSARAEAQP